jgi:UDPglucose 6-dehydrogenase
MVTPLGGVRRISVFGLGYVGLVTAACFAKRGHRVIGIDTDGEKVEIVQNAKPPIFEPNLATLLKETVGNGNLQASQDPSANSESELAYLAVGTPTDQDGNADLGQVRSAASMIAQSLAQVDRDQLVIIKSTVPPGTARNIVKPILERGSRKIVGKQIGLCSNPEFLREGRAIHDAEFPDRIIVGSDDTDAIKRLEDFYREFHGEHMPPVIRTTYENAELIKYANNAFLATKVSLINHMANLAEKVPHADISAVAAGIGLDERISPHFLRAGLGWGGSCLPKDMKALAAISRTLIHDPGLVEAVTRVNQRQWWKAIELAKQALGSLRGRRIAVLGLAFKPDTDDMREAVSIPIVKSLLAEGATVVVYDPAARERARTIFQNVISYASDPMRCMDQADCCIIVTEWDEFKNIRPETFLERMKHPTIIDGRRIYDPRTYAQAGIQFLAIGLGPPTERP